ncbi:MAG: hypothetical protein WCN95_13510 [bacterium]
MLPAMVCIPRVLLISLLPVVFTAGCGDDKKTGASCDFAGKWPAGRQCVYQAEIREQTITTAPGSSSVLQPKVKQGPVRNIDHGMATSVLEVVWQKVEANLSVRDGSSDRSRIADFVIVSAVVERQQRLKDDPGRIVRRKLIGVTGAHVACTMASSGAVGKVDGVEGFMRQAINDGPLASETFASVFNEDFLRQMRITGWKYLPDGSAVPGYEWVTSDRIEFSGIGKILVWRRHRFEKWERHGSSVYAKISWWSCVGNVVDTSLADDVLPDTVKKVQSVGWCLFSPSLGLVVEWCEDLSVVTALEMPDRSVVQSDATQEIRRRIGVTLTGQVVDSREGSGRLFGDKKVSAGKKPREMEVKQ